ncbi:hypothetical protein CFC21_078904 [Triticum aestivum]|uniref:Uncharacterized protein n=2 Tax=Triticum aestivum TaxID=4565 RepID=A0A9R1L196_WHEAT|nr:hypothetical protein CFC21_078903 [Triticum aestivum]KAF7073992.1 hypothetical protein CFC21_078904 [Triticum aestivum]
MSSLAAGYGLDLDLELGIWFAGLFSAPELAAADLLLQLSVLGEAEATKPSRSSASSCCEGLSVGVEERVFEETPSSPSTELLDARARKRYRPLSELYSDTIPPTSAAAAVKKKRRKTHHDHRGASSSWESEATRYGGDY